MTPPSRLWPLMTRPWSRLLLARAVLPPFPVLSVSLLSPKGVRTVDPRSSDGPVDEGQDPAVRSLRRRDRWFPHRRRAARPHRASLVRLPGPQPWPSLAPRHAAHGRLGR